MSTKFIITTIILLGIISLFVFFRTSQAPSQAPDTTSTTPTNQEQPQDQDTEAPTDSSAKQTILESLKGTAIFLSSPLPNQVITSPITITGQAPGTWFFEASMPVTLTDWDGLIIAEGYVTAEEDWMTENYISFSGTLEFTKPSYGERGAFIIRKDNPSGLPEHDDAVEMTIFFE